MHLLSKKLATSGKLKALSCKTQTAGFDGNKTENTTKRRKRRKTEKIGKREVGQL